MQSVSNPTTSQSQPATGAAAQNASQAQTSRSTANADFQNFLMLLTAQMRNQDPLAPLDSTQFVEQLASFSSVEQQIETNSKLDALADRLSINAIDEASKWIGKGVEALSGGARFEGEALDYIIPEGPFDSTAEIVVSDRAGNVVYQQQISSARQNFTWNGEDRNGGVAAHGDYVVSINRYDNEGLIGVSEPLALTRVAQARFESDGVKLVLENGDVVEPMGVAALRDLEPAKEKSSDVLSGNI